MPSANPSPGCSATAADASRNPTRGLRPGRGKTYA